MNVRRARGASAAALLGVLLVSCGGHSAPLAIKAPTTCTTPDPGVTGDRIKVGAIFPTTGPQGPFFKAVGSGIQARFHAENSLGGVGGRELQLLTADDGDGQLANGAAAQQLVQTDKVFGVIEVSTSSDGSGPYLNRNGIPVTGWGITPAWGQYKNMFGYRYSTSPKPEGEPTTRPAAFMKDHGAHRVAVIAGGAAASINAANQLIQTLPTFGLTLAYKNLDEALGQHDFSRDATQFRAMGVDSLYTGMDTNANIALYEAAKQAGVRLNVALFPAGYDARLAAAFGPQLEGAYFDIDWRPFELPVPAHDRFKQELHTVAPDEFPGQLAMVGWLSADVFIRGLHEAGAGCPTRAAFIRNLRLVKDYTADGLLPPTDFTAVFGKMPLCFWVLQLHDSKFVPTSTDPFCGVPFKDYHP